MSLKWDINTILSVQNSGRYFLVTTERSGSVCKISTSQVMETRKIQIRESTVTEVPHNAVVRDKRRGRNEQVERTKVVI